MAYKGNFQFDSDMDWVEHGEIYNICLCCRKRYPAGYYDSNGAGVEYWVDNERPCNCDGRALMVGLEKFVREPKLDRAGERLHALLSRMVRDQIDTWTVCRLSHYLGKTFVQIMNMQAIDILDNYCDMLKKPIAEIGDEREDQGCITQQ